MLRCINLTLYYTVVFALKNTAVELENCSPFKESQETSWEKIAYFIHVIGMTSHPGNLVEIKKKKKSHPLNLWFP